MKARLAIPIIAGFFLNLAVLAQADSDRSERRPGRYQPIDLPALQEQMKRVQQGKPLTQKEIHAMSAEVHGVAVLNAATTDSDAIPASTRPHGALKLERVVH